MTREKLTQLANEFSDNSPLNFVQPTTASSDEPDTNNYAKNNLTVAGINFANELNTPESSDLIGMRFYQHPIFSIARADDPAYQKIKHPDAVGPHHFLPNDWLPDAKSVISFFLPFEQRTVEANKKDPIEPAPEWLYTRVDGQRFLLALGALIRDELIKEGLKAVTPHTDDRFIIRIGKVASPENEHMPPYSSNWSERHVAVASGLGTFGISTNFISKQGCAGRLVSIVTNWETEPDTHDYNDWLDYCNRCGACIKRCPANAHIPNSALKDHGKCGEFIRSVCQKYTPRYGCGKCQSGIPCEYKPMKAR